MNQMAEMCMKYGIDFSCTIAGITILNKFFPLGRVEDAEQWIQAIIDNPSAPQSNLKLF